MRLSSIWDGPRARRSFLAAAALLGASGLAVPPSKAEADEAGPLPGLPAFVRQWPGIGRLSVDADGASAASAQGDVVMKIGGRLHYDVSAAGTSPALPQPALTADGAIRRAWFEPQVTFGRDLTLSLQYDFARTATPIDDALVSYKGVDPFILVLGNFKEPFSMNQLESNNTTLFAERSLLDAFAPNRDFGLALGAHGARWTVSGGVFGGRPNLGVAEDGVAGTARATYAPILTRFEVLHLGVAGSYRALDRGGRALSFASTPEDALFRTSLVSTGTIRDADAVGRLGLEAAYERGPFRLQGEVVRTAVSGRGAPDRSFAAAYLEGAWTINGDGRRYRVSARNATEYGVFEGVALEEGQRVSRGGIGVFELGLRFSAVDLASGPVRGGAQRDADVGLNWYPEDDLRVTADYVHARADPSAASVTGRRVDSELFVGRLQIYW